MKNQQINICRELSKLSKQEGFKIKAKHYRSNLFQQITWIVELYKEGRFISYFDYTYKIGEDKALILDRFSMYLQSLLFRLKVERGEAKYPDNLLTISEQGVQWANTFNKVNKRRLQ